MTSDEPAPGGAPPSRLNKNNIMSVCAKIKREVFLIPPVLIDKLCKGQPLPPIDSDAIFVEELLEIARKLGRMHLVTIIKGDP